MSMGEINNNKPVYCGSFSIDPFITKKNYSKEQIAVLEQRLEDFDKSIIEVMKNYYYNMIEKPAIEAAYPSIDTKFLREAIMIDNDNSKINIPRFAIIDISKRISNKITLRYTKDRMFQHVLIQSSVEYDDLLIHQLYNLHGGTISTYRRNNEDYRSYDSSDAKRMLKEIEKHTEQRINNNVCLDITCNINFLIPKDSLTKMAKGKKYFNDTPYLLVIDAGHDGWNKSTWDSDGKNIEIKSSTKKPTNILLVNKHLEEYYLIDIFNPEYSEDDKENNGLGIEDINKNMSNTTANEANNHD